MSFQSIRVDNNDLNLITSKNVLMNYYQGLSTHVGDSLGNKPGFVNANYEGEAKINTASVVAFRFERPTASIRTLGGGVNGGFISTTPSAISENSTFKLELLTVFDNIYDIPALQQGVLNYSILNEYALNIGGILQEFVDETTFEEVYEASKAYDTAQPAEGTIVTLANNAGADITFADLKAKIIQSRRELSNLKFNTDNTSDRQVPVKGRVFVGSDEVVDTLAVEGVFVTGSDLAYKTIIQGVETETAGSFERTEVANMNYRGKYYGIDFFRMHEELIPNVTKGNVTAGQVYGIFSHAGATTRAISQDLVKQVDGQNYIGVKVQYLRRWGIKCFKPWFNKVLVSADFAA